MRTATATLLLFAVLTAAAPLAGAATAKARVSPHETISTVVEKDRITITYGRPYSKDPKKDKIRTIWGGLVPYGKVWRAGADEATLMIAQKPIKLGGTLVPAGAYTLNMQPEADGSAKLILSTQIGQWGIPYKPGSDFARVDLVRAPLDPALDQFTMEIDQSKDGGGILKLMWESTQYSVTFTVEK